MILIINTCEKEYYIALAKDKIINQVKWSDSNLTISLLKNINIILLKNNLEFKDLEKIIVSHGPGSFTSTRIGLSTANALAYGLKIPIASFEAGKDITKMLRLKNLIFKDQVISAKYASAPHITLNP